MASDDRPEHDDEVCPTLTRPCWKCHIESLTLGLPRDHPTKTWTKMKPKDAPNNYEKGVPTQARPGGTQMPFLTADGSVMGQREFDQKRRLIEENKRRLHNAPASTS